MTHLDNILRRYNFEACVAPGRIWSLADAADYLAAHQAMELNWPSREDALSGLMAIRNKLLAAMIKSIEAGKLRVNEIYLESGDGASTSDESGLDTNKSTVRPFILINWAIAHNIEVPEEFSQYLAIKKSSKAVEAEYLDVKKSTIHHERSRAVAELLWENDPDLPIAQMARRREIIQIGCQGHEYDMRTISRWLASLKADRKPGRVGKKEIIPLEDVKNDDIQESKSGRCKTDTFNRRKR